MQRKNIVLIDYTLDGHHLSYLRTFSKVLLDQGNRVICIAPGVNKIKEWLLQTCAEKVEFFHSYEYITDSKSYQAFGKFNHTLSILSRWKIEASQIKNIQSELKLKIDLVFYAWLDNQLAAFIPPFVLDKIFPFKWSGLYFHPLHLRLEARSFKHKANWRDWDAILLAKNCLAVTVLDLGIQSGFQNRIGKRVIHFPDIADDSTPDTNYALAKEIKAKAAGRTVVGIIGCEGHKGTLTMANLALLTNPQQFYFVFLGILPEQTYAKEDWEELQVFIQENRENCFFKFESLPEGAAYNAVFSTFDIPFLVYNNFVSSSNRLTKAAIFHKLVLAADKYCVGENVQRYDLGEVVKPMDAEAALKGLEVVLQRIRSKSLPHKNWQVYRELNSEAKLYERFAELTGLL